MILTIRYERNPEATVWNGSKEIHVRKNPFS